MADFSMLDTEFTIWGPTFVDKGGNPVTKPPQGASIVYTTDNPAILQLTQQGLDVRVGSGSIGTASITATPGGTISGFPAVTATIEILETEPNALNMSFGTPQPE